jgi:hypothetical protein
MQETPPPKRNYIRRKKCLNDSYSVVKSTLAFISRGLGTTISPSDLDSRARGHAEAIEAVCWGAHSSRLTDHAYRQMMAAKTRELCIALLQRIPRDRTALLIQQLSTPNHRRPFPVPAIPHGGEGGELPQSDPFEEIGRLRFEPTDLFYDGNDG